MPKHKGPVYVVKSATAPTKTARPHWATIVSYFLSPILAMVAVGISIRSLNISARSLELGQRAYLVVKNGKMSVRPEPQFQFQAPPGHRIYMVVMTVILENLGNTPAHFTAFKNQYYGPKRWTPTQLKSISNLKPLPPDLGPKQSETWVEGGYLDVDLSSYDPTAVSVKPTLVYQDVFNKTEELRWCWTEPIGGETASFSCSSVDFKLAPRPLVPFN